MTSPPAKGSSGDERAGEPGEGVKPATQRALTPPPLPLAVTPGASEPPEVVPAAASPVMPAAVSPAMPPAMPAGVPAVASTGAPADASSAPTLRPPPGPATSSALAVSAGGADGRGSGFTSVIRHLSLRGWLRWIHSNHCDATLRIRARDGGNGIIWCSAGTIVDAEWSAGVPGGAAPGAGASSPASQVVADGAVQEMLRLGSGSVSIDFDPVDRAPRVSRSTHELLHPLRAGAVLGDRRRATERHWRPGSMQEPVFRPAPISPADTAPAATALAASVADASAPGTSLGDVELASEAERPRARWQPPARWRVSRGSYLLGGMGFAALMLLAFIFGRSRGAQDTELVVIGPQEQERAQQTRSGLLPPPATASPALAPQATTSAAPRSRELPVIPFTQIEVEPAQAEIWLDQALVGVGRIELAALRDGALHELRFVAPGHVSRSLYFLEQPPAGRIVLERAGAAPAPSAASAPEPGDELALSAAAQAQPESAPAARPATREPPREAARSVPRRRAPPPRPAAEPPVAAKAPPAKKSPQIQLIDARVPRVQVLE